MPQHLYPFSSSLTLRNCNTHGIVAAIIATGREVGIISSLFCTVVVVAKMEDGSGTVVVASSAVEVATMALTSDEGFSVTSFDDVPNSLGWTTVLLFLVNLARFAGRSIATVRRGC